MEKERNSKKVQKHPDKLKFFYKNYDLCMENIRKGGRKQDDSSSENKKNSISHVKHYISGVDMTKVLSPNSELLSLSNREDIDNFYEYIENCIDAMRTMIIPEDSDIEDLKIDLSAELMEEYKEKGKIAVFDLDETLIHCVLGSDKINDADKQITVKFAGQNKSATMGINLRPGWREALEIIGQWYLCVVYTASHKNYADAVLDELDPDRKLMKLRLYRNDCYKGEFDGNLVYVKDMRIFNGVSLSDIVMIDNSALSFAHQLNNGIPIMPFYNNKFDIELSSLTAFLEFLKQSKDVRVDIKELFQLESLVEKVVESDFKEQYDSFSHMSFANH